MQGSEPKIVTVEERDYQRAQHLIDDGALVVVVRVVGNSCSHIVCKDDVTAALLSALLAAQNGVVVESVNNADQLTGRPMFFVELGATRIVEICTDLVRSLTPTS